uniref:Uncharacterized protein n=1 Tax=Onchocerca volvulus TaxID=6282 RepID=A0A8R1TWG8_ONCVO
MIKKITETSKQLNEIGNKMEENMRKKGKKKLKEWNKASKNWDQIIIFDRNASDNYDRDRNEARICKKIRKNESIQMNKLVIRGNGEIRKTTKYTVSLQKKTNKTKKVRNVAKDLEEEKMFGSKIDKNKGNKIQEKLKVNEK